MPVIVLVVLLVCAHAAADSPSQCNGGPSYNVKPCFHVVRIGMMTCKLISRCCWDIEENLCIKLEASSKNREDHAVEKPTNSRESPYESPDFMQKLEINRNTEPIVATTTLIQATSINLYSDLNHDSENAGIKTVILSAIPPSVSEEPASTQDDGSGFSEEKAPNIDVAQKNDGGQRYQDDNDKKVLRRLRQEQRRIKKEFKDRMREERRNSKENEKRKNTAGILENQKSESPLAGVYFQWTKTTLLDEGAITEHLSEIASGMGSVVLEENLEYEQPDYVPIDMINPTREHEWHKNTSFEP